MNPKATKPPVTHAPAAGSPQDPVEAAVEALYILLMKEDVANAALKRLLLAWHPDKVKGTSFEPVFNKMTQRINSLRENVQ